MPDVIQTVVHDYAGRVLVARAEGATALVVGAGSLGATSTKMLGSVSEYCVRHSPVPVVVVPEPELRRVPALIEELLADPARLKSMSAAMRSMARPEAADEIAEELIALASRSWRGSPGAGPEGTV